MVWLELFGPDSDGKPPSAERITTPFPGVSEAIAKGNAMAASSTFSFGRAMGYRLYDEDKSSRMGAQLSFVVE